MEKKKYNITVGNETKEFEEGTTYQAVAKEFCGSFSHPAVLAVEGENRLQELRKTVEKDCELKFITTADAIGHETYLSLIHIQMCIRDSIGRENDTGISFGNGTDVIKTL